MTPTAPSRNSTAEHARLAQAAGRAEEDFFDSNPWYEWGPYLADRAWGTVREDYSDSGDAWSFFPMIMPAPAPTGGTKTAWLAYPTFTTIYVLPWRCGTASIRS